MSESSTCLYSKLKSFCDKNEQFSIAFKLIECDKNLKREQKNNASLYYIARELFHLPSSYEQIREHFSTELPLLLNISILFNDIYKFNTNRHLLNCILLSKLIREQPELKTYASSYFIKYPCPFEQEQQNTAKKRKMGHGIQINQLDLVEACYLLLKSDADFFRKAWNWSNFIKQYLNHAEDEVKWVACNTIGILFGMNEKQLEKLIKKYIPLERVLEFTCTFCKFNTLNPTTLSKSSLDQHPTITIPKSSTAEQMVKIADIYLPTVRNLTYKENLVIVPSTYNNLRKIALGLCANRAICLQGPVGCGKTTLVEYLANKTGRKLGIDFIKVQLGDQTDGKMLLGTYRCTDVPGEFIWLPGVLTQAVTEGNWLLLEDIDCANSDIASILTGLLENRSLTVPGYRDSVRIAPGFQLFVTQRLISTISGHHKKHSNVMALLEKHLLQIRIDPLNPDELKQILIANYEQFHTIADRMVRVFQLFSRDSETNAMPKSGRLISTRDFFKWCSRAVQDFHVSSQESALKVLQDAIDVFCCSFACTEVALNIAKEISTHLGIINQKAEYFFQIYKPTMQLTSTNFNVGRASLCRNNDIAMKSAKFSFTRPSAVLLERIMCCVGLNEPVLLVGETGTGKTSSIQYLANTIGQKLIVINMNQQSDSADLLGGYKPVDFKFILSPIRQEFEHIFADYFKVEPNRKYLSNIALCFNQQRYTDLVKMMHVSYQAAVSRLNKDIDDKNASIEKIEKAKEFTTRWLVIGEKLQKLSLQLKQKNALAFAFIEGSLVQAVEKGYWVLLDEINLANAETLECLSGLLEGKDGSICLLERGDKQSVKRHPNFTLFACMNPSTDVGKKDLPAGLRNRFTEFFVDELTEKSDLLLLVNSYLEAMSLKDRELNKIVDFYLKIRKDTITTLSDGLGHKPHYSLRSLCRALIIASKNPCGTFKRSLYEAFCLSFLTQLDSLSYKIVEQTIRKSLIGDEKILNAILKQPIPEPKETGKFLQFEGYWLRQGDLEPNIPEDYILTQSVRKNLTDLVRIVSIGKLPVLLQGDTAVGKTSLITYLAKSSGNKCVRINNHEHSDLQEYIGSYVADVNGKLVFREGLLVEAMRKGHWIILDELNLAPSDVLEALNRVLDDNRELFIPETQETVKANKNFMLFATQNPPGAYGGRKMLSRAFRNRFVELHFNEIPPKELETILHKRCHMAPSYAKKMINVMMELQTRRRGSAAFAGKQGFITLRDLFRWGERYRLAQNTDKLYDWDQHLADEGYLALAGRVRRSEEKKEILEVLQKHLKRIVEPYNLFTLSKKTSTVTKQILEKIHNNQQKYRNIVWTYNMRQLAVLVAKAMQFKEPVLLVGETGGGKTTVCQLIAENNNQKLITVNCHMHTESSDFIGGLRPVRDHTNNDSTKLFEWVDGPLVEAMVNGNVFLADEISLADDSVLERLNSLLEPERTLLIAEKGIDLNNPNNSEQIVAHKNFYFIGTMNPGGDFGKKELSPALRNRFTEIWCETCTNRDDLIAIIEQNVQSGISFGNQEDGSSGVGKFIMNFIEWFINTEIGKRFTVSIRDILTWVNFINVCAENMNISNAYVHGANLTFLDSLGSGVTSTESLKRLELFKKECQQFLEKQLASIAQTVTKFDDINVEITDSKFGIYPFFIQHGDYVSNRDQFSFNAPTTLYNTLRLLRGMQLNKAILLEGSPGVGKTSLVSALAKYTGHKLFRVNLSDQTDISDLFGADLPVEGGSGGQFSWRDGPLLQALKDGSWILLDELNLASQSVLEGLNACLDHRGEIFIPELGKTFFVPQGTKFFACQNPLKQGGSRRGLPKSFLNRFIQVFVNSLTNDDLFFILSKQFPQLAIDLINKMINFNSCIVRELDEYTFGNKGGPWECNLRDLTRWCEATLFVGTDENGVYRPENVIQLIYTDRMRTIADKNFINRIFETVFGCKVCGNEPVLYLNKDCVFIGDVSVKRNVEEFNSNVFKWEDDYLVLRTQLNTLRSLAYCVGLNWMSILVGGSGCGKTSAVKTLANLVGKTLKTLPVTSSMDTTDILGGFEQTDYTRHLDEMVKSTEELLYVTIQDLLINARTDDGSMLLMHWESYLETNDSSKRTMSEEAKLFVRKLEKLVNILENIAKFNKNLTNKLDIVKMKATKLLKQIKIDESLNAGGKFEWVDSVLIKCLQEGNWLLVDNVNLCNAAVLDRLNALLEPNGILTVAERGVDNNGQMVEIKPHADFRLFLTMDPKNGEISRAMRNRGVEIYLLPETQTILQNNLDAKSLIHLKGIKNRKFVEILLNLHKFINDLILCEKATINELLQVSENVSQQLNNGVDCFQAIFNGFIEIYYKKRSTFEFNSNDVVSIIKDEIQRLICVDYCETNEYNCENVSLKCKNVQVCCTLEKIQQQSNLLMNNFNESNRILNFLLINYYGITSKEDLNLRHVYFKMNCKNAELIQLADKFYEIVGKFVTTNLPIDHRWTPNISITNQFDSNKLNLCLNIVGNFFLHHNLMNEQKMNGKLTLLDYMYERQRKNVDDKFENVVINKFLELIASFDEFLNDLQHNVRFISDENVIQVLCLIMWRFFFHNCTLVDVQNTTSRQRYDITTNINVHYKWFVKYSLNAVTKLTNFEIPANFVRLVTSINDKLEKQFSLMYKLGKNYQKYNDRPNPVINEKQLEIRQKFEDVMNVYNLFDSRNDVIKIVEHFYTNPMFHQRLVRTVRLKSSENVEECEIECIKSQQLERSKFNHELCLITDIFNRLHVRRIFSTNQYVLNDMNIMLSVKMCGQIHRINNNKNDVNLLHEMRLEYFQYLMNSPCIMPNKYLKQLELQLSAFNPHLTFYVNYLLVNADMKDGNATTLGNYRDLLKEHQFLNNIIWTNMFQIDEPAYDYLENENNYITQSFEQFIRKLAHSVNLHNTMDFSSMEKTIETLLPALKAIKIDTLLTDSRNNLPQFIQNIQNCYDNYTKLSTVKDFNEKLLIISDLYMEVGLLKAILNSKLPQIDPLAKKSLKRKYLQHTIDHFNDMKKCYEFQNEIYSGPIHSYYIWVNKLIEGLLKKGETLEKSVAFRPKNLLYEIVLRVINHAFSTILTADFVEKINHDLNTTINKLRNDCEINLCECKSILNQHESSTISYQSILNEWSKFRVGYPDIIEPLLCDVAEFLYGFKLKLSLLRKLIVDYEYNRRNESFLSHFVRLPSLNRTYSDYGQQIQLYCSKNWWNFIGDLVENEEFPHIKRIECLRLLKSGIQESFNHCAINRQSNSSIKRNLFKNFCSLLDELISIWNKHLADKEQKENEAESLYKTRTKCEHKSEVEQIDDELKMLFPNYHDKDFADFQTNIDMADSDHKSLECDFVLDVSDKDLKFAMELHSILLKNLTKTEWLNPDKNKRFTNIDYIQPLMEKYKVFKRILQRTVHSFDYKLDIDLMASLNVLVAVCRPNGDHSSFMDIESPSRILNKRMQDFYNDSNIEEVKSVYHILENLKRHVEADLLDKWPDQPTLKSIIVVIDRIYSFNITSPVSRYLTGLEILLSKCYEWEQVAHSGVSLSDFSQELTQQIICWRKMELNMWKDSLNKTYERLNEPISKWWIYIYNIMREFIVEKRFTNEELIETLQLFITRSNLAEFHNRLELLYIFHCHATYLERTKESKNFIKILWNLYCYFDQFAINISNKIKDLRTPIEKKLKDYVKIVRWKDINYWAIKETVEKSHKTLHKFIREYQEVLQQTVTPFLINDTYREENTGIWDRPQRQSPKTYHYTLDSESYIAKSTLFKRALDERSNKNETYFMKSRKLSKEIIISTKYPNLMQSLDTFVTDIVETSQHLQKLEVNTSLSKDKQKSQAKNILQQKHRALADLFKNLSKIGLSYRTGIVNSKIKALASDFLIKPIDLNANFSHFEKRNNNEKILTIWDNCELYYVKSLMRADVLETALKNPAKDLGIQNMERCKGFASHLIMLAQKQKTTLINTTRYFSYLSYYSKQLQDICDGKQFIHISCYEKLQEILNNTSIVLDQYKIILNSCPNENDCIEEFQPITPQVLQSSKTNLIQFKNDQLWLKSMDLIKEAMNLMQKLNSLLIKQKTDFPAFDVNLNQIEFVVINDKEHIQLELKNICDRLQSLQEILGNGSLSDSLKWLIDNISRFNFDETSSSDQELNLNQLKMLINGATNKILVAIQNMYKKYVKSGQTIEEETNLQENHLNKELIDCLEDDFSTLDLNAVFKSCQEFTRIIFTKLSDDYISVVLEYLPHLDQILLLCQYFITQQVSSYRLTVKMASILLNIFIELVSKGFCVPPEFSDELDSEGVGKPSDGLGLGDGDGERDVSDRIESEDQLDDALPAGQEKQQHEEDPDCKEEENGIEMSEDFDSKLQEKEKNPDDDDDVDSDEDKDAEEQMGETDQNAEQLDKEIWGSDNEDDVDEEQKEEKGDKGEQQGDEQFGAKDEKSSSNEEQNQKDANDEKETTQKDINEMEEKEFDDEQVDPYHGNQPELPEPEPMDLPDDLQLDDGQENDEKQEENPFDIDTMKEQNTVEETETKNEDEDKENDEVKEYSSDEEDIDKDKPEKEDSSEDNNEKSDNQEVKEDGAEEKDLNEDKVPERSDLDQTQSTENNVEAMEVEENAAPDKTQSAQSETQNSNQTIDELCQEDNPDKDGVGQSQMEESKTGHTASSAQNQVDTSKQEPKDEVEEKKQKPGESDSQRTLGDVNEPVKKKLKMMEQSEDQTGEDGSENVEIYQHLKDAKEKSDQVLDVATKEQAEEQHLQKLDEESDDKTAEETENHLEETVDDVDMNEIESKASEKVDSDRQKPNKKQHPDGDVLEEIQQVDVEGEIIQTETVPRNLDTTYHTDYRFLLESTSERLTIEETNQLRQEVENQLSCWHEPPPNLEAEQAWQKISSVTSSMAQDLAEQLRLVLEPTQASRLKGDFRTGRRINMRKIIPYIASQFRKDKIWLRRTKPSKRDYQIVLAIDDSSSMADNHSKELAFESVALISKALTLLESGQLGVVSFGETTDILHSLTDQFTDRSGMKLLQKFQFNQNKTCIGRLVDFVNEMFMQNSSTFSVRLLVIVSDGRGVFSEGEQSVRQSIRRAKLANIFMVFVIIDNPENKNSILDIRMPIFKDGQLLGIDSYMDVFPFSFYIILRDINSLPSVLSDALRQWFEVVSNLDKI